MEKRFVVWLLSFGCLLPVSAQSISTPNAADFRTQQQLEEQAKALLAKAESSPSGSAGATLEKYPNHYTMLTVRTKSGGVEMHQHASDIFVVLSGQATVLTGGHIVDQKQIRDGEFTGTSIEGAVSHTVHTGDVVHISPNVPHQTVVEPGHTFTYYVIKVLE